jgi:hypothetical protein
MKKVNIIMDMKDALDTDLAGYPADLKYRISFEAGYRISGRIVYSTV